MCYKQLKLYQTFVLYWNDNDAYASSDKTGIVWIKRELFNLPGVDKSHVYVSACLDARLLPQSYQYPNLSEGAAADRVGGQVRGDKECPFSDVTKSGRVWSGKVPKTMLGVCGEPWPEHWLGCSVSASLSLKTNWEPMSLGCAFKKGNWHSLGNYRPISLDFCPLTDPGKKYLLPHHVKNIYCHTTLAKPIIS